MSYLIDKTGPEWLQRYFAGMDIGCSLGRIRVIDETVHFALIKIPGGSHWAGIGVPREYHPVEWCIVDKRSDAFKAMSRPIMGHEGRARSGRITGWMRELQRLEAEAVREEIAGGSK